MHLHAFIFLSALNQNPKINFNNLFQESWPQSELFFLCALNLHLCVHLLCALFVYSAINPDPVRFKWSTRVTSLDGVVYTEIEKNK